MERDIAERLASTAVEKLSPEQTGAIISEFLAYLVLCPACNDTGTVEFGYDANVALKNGGLESKFVPAGSVIACPRCGGPDEKGNLRHDPKFVAWHCVSDVMYGPCCHPRDAPEAKHAACGYRVMLPLPEAAK